MYKILVALAATAAIAATPAYAAMDKNAYKSTTKQIDDTFKADKANCKSLKANAKDICMAQAKGNEKIAKAEVEARDKGTAKSRQDFLVAKAEANHDVAKAKCDDLAGNAKSVCQKEAEASFTKAKADATLERKVIALACAAVALMLAACNTLEGAGRDIERGGEKIQGAADRNK